MNVYYNNFIDLQNLGSLGIKLGRARCPIKCENFNYIVVLENKCQNLRNKLKSEVLNCNRLLYAMKLKDACSLEDKL